MSNSTTAAVRASDAEREQVVARLHHALGEGRLDLAETESRVAAAYAATHRDDLLPLVGDLPAAGAAPTEAPTWSTVWASIVWRLRTAVCGTERFAGPPDARQRRLAAVLTTLALAGFVGCAFLGGAAVEQGDPGHHLGGRDSTHGKQ